MVHIGLIIWHQFLFCKINVLLSVFIVSKIENIPPIRKFSKIKNKKTAITFGEECRCKISWVNYDKGSGNALPDGAIIAGYQNGHPLYVAWRGDTHSGHPYRYATGYYDHIDMEGAVTYGSNVYTFTGMEILVVT